MSRDRGVHPDLMRRHFGDAGTGATLPAWKRRELELDAKREAAAKLAKLQRALPKKPPRKPEQEADTNESDTGKSLKSR